MLDGLIVCVLERRVAADECDEMCLLHTGNWLWCASGARIWFECFG